MGLGDTPNGRPSHILAFQESNKKKKNGCC